jgi:hypothetical protein
MKGESAQTETDEKGEKKERAETAREATVLIIDTVSFDSLHA